MLFLHMDFKELNEPRYQQFERKRQHEKRKKIPLRHGISEDTKAGEVVTGEGRLSAKRFAKVFEKASMFSAEVMVRRSLVEFFGGSLASRSPSRQKPRQIRSPNEPNLEINRYLGCK